MPATNPTHDQQPAGPLHGVRVLDLIDGAAAYGPKLLVGLGANVIRVERPDGSKHRRRPPLVRSLDGDGPSLYFLHYNAGKQGITLDPDRNGGCSLLARLLDSTDLVFDNGELSRLGFDLDALTAERPLVVVSVTPFGLHGARSSWQGGDLVCQSMSGMIGLYGARDARPSRIGPEQAFEMGGMAAALGGLIALYDTRRSGVGEVVDIAIERVSTMVTLQMSNASMYHQFGVARSRRPRDEVMHGTLYETCDGWALLGAYRRLDELLAMLGDTSTGHELRAARQRLGDEAFARDPDVEDALRRYCSGMTRAALVDAAQANGMLGLPVNDVADLLADPFLQSRAFFVEVEHPELGIAGVDSGAPVRFSAGAYRASRRPPLLGEHNAVVYASLGVDADALARLRAEGVV
jgi:crotonobetainyl-CoA:carnitine CoA-transferase CaiB-like acyl-CoA transferase